MIIQSTRNPANWARFSGSVINTGFPSGTDTAYAKCLLLDAAGGVGWRHIVPIATGLTDHWWQLEWFPGGFAGATNIISFYDATGVLRYVMDMNGGVVRLKYLSTAPSTYTTIATLPGLSNVWYTITLRTKIAASGGEVSVYLNGTLIGSPFTGNTLASGSGGLLYADLQNNTIGSGASANRYYGAVTVTTGDENPYGIKPAQLVLTADGTYAEWLPTPSWQNVDDPGIVDLTDIISTPTTGKRASFVMTDPPTPAASERIRGVYHTVVARGGSSGPIGYNHGLRYGGVDLLSPTVPLTTSWKTDGYMFEGDASSNEFTPSGVAGSEGLVVSA